MGPRNVWFAPGFAVAPQSKRIGPTIQRVRRDVRFDFDYLGLLPAAIERCTICCRGIHHGSLLVHCVYILRQPGGHDCAVSQRYVRGHPARGCSWVRGGSIFRGHLRPLCSSAGSLPVWKRKPGNSSSLMILDRTPLRNNSARPPGRHRKRREVISQRLQLLASGAKIASPARRNAGQCNCSRLEHLFPI